ncbi:MAG: TonB-dependent receptor [Ignavibacteriales bacterium]|nr:TonB-dependent receptor [Ignavibacteriales bacterium]
MTKKVIQLLAYCLLFLQLISTSLISAPNGKIKGTVKDSQSKEPLPYSNVVLKGTSLGSAADFDGNYLIQNIPPGTYTVRATYLGYKQTEIKIEVREGRTTEYNFVLDVESVLGDTLIVTAQAEGQKKAINEQLSSIAIKNVVSAARIQELPDANAAESVSRLPGVSIIRTGGEGSKVVVRGLSPQYNRVTIDGVELPANESSNDPTSHRTEFKENNELSLSGDRASDLSMISSNMLGGIEVIKAITPDMDATVFGGVVNFSMRKAFKNDFNAPRFEILTQGSHNNLKNTYKDYKVVGSYEQRFFGNSFGVFAQGSAEKKNLSDQSLVVNYDYSGTIDVNERGFPFFVSMTPTDVLRNRDRYGATLVFDYLYETGSIGFMNFYSRSNTEATFRKESYYLLDDDAYYSATHSKTDLDVISNLLSIKQSIGDVGVDIKLSHSYARTENPEDVSFNFWQNGAGFTNKYNSLKYMPPRQIAENVFRNPNNAVFFDISNIGNISKDRTYNAALDLYTDFTISDELSAKIKAGGSYQHRNRSYDYNQSSGSVFYDDGGQVSSAILRAYPQFGESITFTDFIDHDYDYGNFLRGDYALGDPLDVDLMLDVIKIAKKNPGAGNGGGYKVHKLATLLYDYSGNEDRSAVYGMATFNIGQMFTILPGVRYQNLTTKYSGIRGEQIPGDIQYTKAEEKLSHGYVLPMFHFRVKPLEWLQINFAYTNTLNYPDYNTIIPRFYIGTNYIIYNNYRLKPATSENFDVMVSIYSNEIGLFSVGGFKKRIEDLIIPYRTYPTDYSAYPELYEKLKNKKESYTLHTYINNQHSIDVLGLETEWQTNFWYLPQPFTGLVLNVNYTHIFSEAQYPRIFKTTYLDSNFIQQTKTTEASYKTRLLNQPNDVVNIALGYDYEGFSMRISLLYKADIFKNPDFWPEKRIHSDEYLRFDLSVKQELPWYGIQAYLNINNINGRDDTDINEVSTFTAWQQDYGMTADVGLRIKF